MTQHENHDDKSLLALFQQALSNFAVTSEISARAMKCKANGPLFTLCLFGLGFKYLHKYWNIEILQNCQQGMWKRKQFSSTLVRMTQNENHNDKSLLALYDTYISPNERWFMYLKVMH